MPENIIIPVIDYPDIDEAIKWLTEKFGFKLRLKIGSHRAQLYVQQGAAIVVKKNNKNYPDTTNISIMIRILDINTFYNRIKQSEVNIINELTDYPFGESQFTIKDYNGYVWTFSETISDQEPESWGGKFYPT